MAQAQEAHPEDNNLTRARFAPADNKHLQFFCEVPKQQIGSWIKENNGAYNPGKKAYVFLMSALPNVEKAVGFKAGESGLHDPNQYFPLVLELELLSVAGREALEKALEPLGIKYSKQKRSFHGSANKAGDLAALAVYLPK